MGGILRIYRNDWRNLFRVPVAVLLVAALVVLPSVYDWVNVASVWDPYSNTSGIKIAVTSLDEGTKVQEKDFNIGNEVMESLRSNKNLGWTFVDAETAHNGVKRGDYYASIVIPANFSKRMTGILEGTIVKPEIEYTVNEKINAIAPKITDKGATSITTQISENFTETISETVFTVLSQIDKEFQSELPIIRKVEKGLFKLEASLPEIETAGKRVLKIQENWPQIHASAERISTLENKLPEVEKAGEALEKIAEHWPQIASTLDHLGGLQDKLPKIEEAAQLIVQLDNHYGEVEQIMAQASQGLTEAHKIVNTALTALPEAEKIATAGNDFVLELQQFLEKSSAAFEAVPAAVKQNLNLLQQTESSVVKLAEQLKGEDNEPQAVREQLEVLSAQLAAGSSVIEHTLSMLNALNTFSPETVSIADLAALKGVDSVLNSQKSLVNAMAADLQNKDNADSSAINQLFLKSGLGKLAIAKLISGYDSSTIPAIKNKLEQITSAADVTATALQQVPDRLPALGTLLEETMSAIEFGQTSLASLQQDLPAIREAVHTAASGVADQTQGFGAFIRDTLPLLESSLPTAGEKIQQAANFVRQDLPTVEERVHQVSELIRTGLPRADKGVALAADLVRNDLPVLEDSIRKAASTIRQIKEEIDLGEIAQLLGGDIKSKSDFLANPVVLKENKLYPIPNYGSAMTPFYVVLSLWVGGTLLVSLLRTGVDTGGLTYKRYQLYFGRLLTFLTVGILQGLVAVLGNIFILHCYVVNKVWFVLFGVLISIVFVTIVFTLVAVFGNLGKGIAIVFMVLQFSSSGGTFPISTTGRFFQILNPYMPFTYAISLMREAVGGILPEVAIRDVIYLIIFGVLALLLALLLKKPLEPFIHKASEQAEESKLIS
ncbi:YhgE/Pip domain-containing protein [Paenibacillus sp. FSL H3-0310]